MEKIERYSLDNGLQVFTKFIPNKQTISCGVLVRQGARLETKDNNGISHLVEHLAFRIKSKYSSQSIQENMCELEKNGVFSNATTHKDYTTFIFQGLASDSELILKNLFYTVAGKENVDKDVLESEKKVVLHEAKGYLNSTAQISDRVCQALWGEKGYGQMVIGTVENVESFTCEMIDNYIQDNYTPDNSAIIVMGEFDKEKLKDTIEKYFGQWKGVKKQKEAVDNTLKSEIRVLNEFGNKRAVMAVGFPTYPIFNPKIQYVEVLKLLFTLPKNSLMNELREKKGLVYVVNRFTNGFAGAGDIGLYFGVDCKQGYEALSVLIEQIELLVKNGIDKETLDILKKQRKLEILLAVERTEEQIKFANTYAMNGMEIDIDALLKDIEAINVENMNEVIREVLSIEKMSLVVLGKMDEEKLKAIIGR